MAEPAPSNPGVDLDRDVDALLHELEESGLPTPPGEEPAPRIEAVGAVSDDGPMPQSALATMETSTEDEQLLADLTQQVDALIAESQARPTGEPAPEEPGAPVATEEPPAAPVESPAAKSPESLSGSPPPAPAEAKPEAQTIDALDAELASLAAGLMNEPTAEVAPPEPSAAPTETTEAPLPGTPAPPAASAPAGAEARVEEPKSPAQPAATSAAPEPAPTLSHATAPVEPEPAKARAAAAAVAHLAGRVITPVSGRAAAILSRPLRNKPKIVRDSIGWLAIFTLFNATGLWGYILLIRKPAIAEAAVSTAADPHSAADQAGHAAESDAGHGAKAPAAKDSGHGAKASDSHGAKKETARKNSGHAAKKTTAKKDSHASAKKPAEKTDGHGSGH